MHDRFTRCAQDPLLLLSDVALNTTLPVAALELLRLATLDITHHKSFRLREYKTRIANLEIRPDAIEDARQAGIQAGLDLAAAVLAERIKTVSDGLVTEESSAQEKAQCALTAARAKLKLAEPGATAPITSAAYSAYAQAYRDVQLASKALAKFRK